MRIRKFMTLLVSLAFILITGFTAFTIYTKADFLTLTYKLVANFALIFLALIALILYFRANWIKVKKSFSKGKKVRIKFFRVFSHFLMFVICACLIVGNLTLSNLEDFINEVGITKQESEEDLLTTYYAFTYKDSGIKSLDDQIPVIGILYEERGALYNPFNNYMEKKHNKVMGTSFDYANYLNKSDLLNGLYNKLIPAMIISSDSYYKILKKDPDFMNKTDLIATVKLVNAIESKPVNVTSESFNVLILGVDIRENEGTIKTDSRCDSIMVASFNPKTMSVSLVSIPRDSYVLVNGVNDKITHAGNSGIGTVVKTVEDLLGIEINYYAKFNFKALVDIIDAIGGVNVDVQYTFDEMDSNDTYNAIHIEKGMRHLNGEQALAYARHRKTVTDSARANAQQQILQAAMGQLVSLSSISNMKKIFTAVSSNMMTNMTTKEIYALMGLAPQLGSLQFGSIVLEVNEGGNVFFPQYNSMMYTCTIKDESLQQAKQQIQQVLG